VERLCLDGTDANKTFDLLVVPEADHGTRGEWTRYTQRNLFDYFVRNLLSEVPPDWNAQSPTRSPTSSSTLASE
jgi:hypothetical protein